MRINLGLILFGLCCFHYSIGQQKLNHLQNETSPYLIQHAKNPVDWYPWNTISLNKAKEENKLIVISIGYSSCHWCHVMEQESFSDTAVSALMNRNFVSIKIDREERPDIDRIYMEACQAVNGDACGWPLNVIALPGGKPVFTGTYMDKAQWLQVLHYFSEQKNTQSDKLIEYGNQLSARIQKENKLIPSAGAVSDSLFQLSFTDLLYTLDLEWGGVKGAPKFPLPGQYEFLLNYDQVFKTPGVLEVVTNTLDQLMKGGIYDWLDGGFARYSTDEKWLVPHFEKMLYDNAQLISLYAHAYQVTKNESYKEVAKSCIHFLQTKFKSPAGGYYSSYDADSEGEEGKYYLWTKSEIETALIDPELIELATELFQLSEEGNTLSSPHYGQAGKNVLAILGSGEKYAEVKKWSKQKLSHQINEIKKRLTLARAKKISPALDNKIICSWNALAITALSDAYIAFGEKELQTQALQAGELLWKSYSPQGLKRIITNGKGTQAFLDDYAYTGLAFIKLYQLSFDERWLERAKTLVDFTQKHFYDHNQHLFYYNLDTLVGRHFDYEDQVMPSSNSAMAFLLHQLGTYYSNDQYIIQSKQMVETAFIQMHANGSLGSYVNWARLHLQTNYNPYFEIAILGNNSLALSHELASKYVPNAIWLGGKTEGELPLLQEKLVPGKTMIYICQNKVCKLPVSTLPEAWKILGIE